MTIKMTSDITQVLSQWKIMPILIILFPCYDNKNDVRYNPGAFSMENNANFGHTFSMLLTAVKLFFTITCKKDDFKLYFPLRKSIRYI